MEHGRKMSKITMILIGVIAIGIIITLIIIGVNSSKKENNDVLPPQNNEEYTKEEQNGDKVNTSKALKEERSELGYYIKNIELKKEDAQTVFRVEIENKTTSVKKSRLVDVVFVDKNDNELARMAMYIRDIEAGKSIKTEAKISKDLTNVYNFKLVERK